MDRDQPIMPIFYLLCYAAVLKFLTYYAQYYAHVISLCWFLYALIATYITLFFAIELLQCDKWYKNVTKGTKHGKNW